MLFRREPAVWIALTAAAVQLAVSFGLELTLVQQAATTAFLTALAGVLTRQVVTPTAAPKLGDSKDITPDLLSAAGKVAHLLPGPIPVLYEMFGEAGLKALVKTAEKALSRPLNETEAEAALRVGRGG